MWSLTVHDLSDCQNYMVNVPNHFAGYEPYKQPPAQDYPLAQTKETVTESRLEAATQLEEVKSELQLEGETSQ